MKETCVSVEWLRDQVARLPCKHKLIILDCCYSGALFQESSAAEGTTQAAADGTGKLRGIGSGSESTALPSDNLRVLAGAPAFMGLSAGRHTPVADGLRNNRHSVFTSSLLRILRDRAYTLRPDQVFTFRALSAAVASEVTETLGSQQIPEFGRLSAGSGDFIFAPKVVRTTERLKTAVRNDARIISDAKNFVDAENFDEARRVLDEIPTQRRGWEWMWINGLTHSFRLLAQVDSIRTALDSYSHEGLPILLLISNSNSVVVITRAEVTSIDLGTGRTVPARRLAGPFQKYVASADGNYVFLMRSPTDCVLLRTDTWTSTQCVIPEALRNYGSVKLSLSPDGNLVGITPYSNVQVSNSISWLELNTGRHRSVSLPPGVKCSCLCWDTQNTLAIWSFDVQPQNPGDRFVRNVNKLVRIDTRSGKVRSSDEVNDQLAPDQQPIAMQPSYAEDRLQLAGYGELLEVTCNNSSISEYFRRRNNDPNNRKLAVILTVQDRFGLLWAFGHRLYSSPVEAGEDAVSLNTAMRTYGETSHTAPDEIVAIARMSPGRIVVATKSGGIHVLDPAPKQSTLNLEARNATHYVGPGFSMAIRSRSPDSSLEVRCQAPPKGAWSEFLSGHQGPEHMDPPKLPDDACNVECLDGKSGKTLWTFRADTWVQALGFVGNRNQVIRRFYSPRWVQLSMDQYHKAVSNEWKNIVHDAKTGQQLYAAPDIEQFDPQWRYYIAGDSLFSCDTQKEIRRFNIRKDGEQTTGLKGFFTNNGRYLYFVKPGDHHSTGTGSIFDVETGSVVASIPPKLNSILSAGDHHVLLSGEGLQLVDLATGTVSGVLGSDDTWSKAIISDDLSYIAAVSERDQQMVVFHVESGVAISRLEDFDAKTSGVFCTQGAVRIFGQPNGGQFSVWDPHSGMLVASIRTSVNGKLSIIDGTDVRISDGDAQVKVSVSSSSHGQ